MGRGADNLGGVYSRSISGKFAGSMLDAFTHSRLHGKSATLRLMTANATLTPNPPPGRTRTLLTTDPDATELFSIGMKIVTGLVILVLSSDPKNIPPPTAGGLIAILGHSASLIGAGLLVIAAIHLGAVLHEKLKTRRVCAVLTMLIWAFFAYLAFDLLGPVDVRPWLYSLLFVFGLWTNWRLWRPGVTRRPAYPTFSPPPESFVGPASSAHQAAHVEHAAPHGEHTPGSPHG